MNKTNLILLIKIFVVGIAIFIGLLYYVLRTKVSDVSSEKPFKTLIDQKVITKRKAIIFKNIDAFVNENEFEIVSDSTQIYNEIKEKYILPIGTELKIEKAKIFTNGTSGFSHSYVLGSVYMKELQKVVAFEYYWGDQNISIYGDEKEHWTFEKALWENTKTEGKFYFD